MKEFDRQKLDKMEGFKTYRKRSYTKAIRIRGPFRVHTTEGTMTCPDGYLAIDSEGNPYPIDRKVFETSYVEIPQ
jgi:hypothetical protein